MERCLFNKMAVSPIMNIAQLNLSARWESVDPEVFADAIIRVENVNIEYSTTLKDYKDQDIALFRRIARGQNFGLKSLCIHDHFLAQ